MIPNGDGIFRYLSLEQSLYCICVLHGATGMWTWSQLKVHSLAQMQKVKENWQMGNYSSSLQKFFSFSLSSQAVNFFLNSSKFQRHLDKKNMFYIHKEVHSHLSKIRQKTHYTFCWQHLNKLCQQKQQMRTFSLIQQDCLLLFLK